MHQDDDLQTTLSKWPFILGDVLLVATALAIAILGNWQLTDWQVAACVISVALGAALFVLPYVVEYRVRIQEGQEARHADLRVVGKQLSRLEQALEAMDARLLNAESAAVEFAQMEASSDLIRAMDRKVSGMEAHAKDQEEKLLALQRQVEELASKEAPEPFDPATLLPLDEQLRSLDERLATFDKQLAAFAEGLAAQDGRLTLLETRPSAKERSEPADAAAATGEAPEQKPDSGGSGGDPRPLRMQDGEQPKLSVPRPKRAARKRHRPEERRLLNRAINDKQDSSSTAVFRIIESKSRVPSEPASSEDNPKSEETLDLNAEVPAMDDSDMLFDEAAITSPVKKTRAKKSDAVLTASVFIGIGNKPYLRGSGAGLNWDSGVAMEFQEIGKWRWVAPPDMEEPVEVQIYRNDEEPDKSGKYIIKPEDKLEVSPVF